MKPEETLYPIESERLGRRPIVPRAFVVGAGVGLLAAFAGFLIRDRLHERDVIRNDQVDRIEITDLIMRERLARETGNWGEEAACFDANAIIAVSWFKGSGVEFVEAAKKSRSTSDLHFDSMSPATITIKNGRAIADTACAVHESSFLDGVDVIMTSYTRLLWRVQLRHGKWLIVGLRGIYVRDELVPSNPNRVPKLDETRLASYRASYRYLAYMLATRGVIPLDDLAGVDRPETVVAMRAEEIKWLDEG